MISRVCSLLRMMVPERNRGLLWASKSRVPSNVTDADGYQGGCIWINTDGAAGTGVWTNEGSVTAAAWVAFDTSAGDAAGTIEFDDATTGPLISIETTDQEGDAYLNPFLITGTYASTCKKGIMLSATNKRPVTFLFDNHSVALGAGDYRAVLSRVYICSDQANVITLNAMRGQIKLADLVDVTNADAMINSVRGYLELAGTGARTVNGHMAGVMAFLEEGASGTTTIGDVLCGFEAQLNSTRTYAGSGFLAAYYAGIHGAGTSLWQYGVEIADDACGIGLHIGNCTTEGILLDGTASSAQLKISGTAILSAGEQAIYINCAAETVATNGIWITLKSSVTSGDVAGIRSRITTTGASGTANNRGVWAQSYVGASGFANVVDGVLAEVSVAAGSADTQHVACLRAHFSAGASFVNDLTFYVIHGRCQTRSDETFSGSNALLGLENEAVGGNGKKLNAIIEAKYTNLSAGVHAADYLIDGGVAVNLIDTAIFRFPDDATVCEASAAGTGDADGADFVGFIKVVIGTTTMYIPLLADTPANVFTT